MQNTRHDYVQILKPFLFWMIENGINTSLPEKKISNNIVSEPVDRNTTSPDELLSKDDVLALIAGALHDRDKALISVLYESGARVGELARLRWRDVVFDEYGVKVVITDTKENKERFSRLTFSKCYLERWMNTYPDKAKGDSPVFLTNAGTPLSYPTLQAMLRRTCDRAERQGWTRKKVHPHLFRKSRITSMVKEGYNGEMIKESMWGNLNSQMFSTYVKLGSQDIDDHFLEMAGIKREDRPKEEPIKPRTCGKCHHVNEPAARYCSICATPLSKEASQAIEEKKALLEDDPLLQLIKNDPGRVLLLLQEAMKKE